LRPATDDTIPILLLNEFTELSRAFAACIKASHKPSHARSRNVVDRDVMVFKPLQYTNMGKTQRAAAFESHTDLRAIRMGRDRSCVLGLQPSVLSQKFAYKSGRRFPGWHRPS